MVIILDNGHGVDTAGKRSPDGRLKEYEWAREIAHRVMMMCREHGLFAWQLVEEENDIPLKERVRRVNHNVKAFKEKSHEECVLVSIHLNAAGSDGKWHNARGFSVWVAPNASKKSKTLASTFTRIAESEGLKGNRSIPAERYWVGNFAIVRDTNCPAVLTESLFMDNEDDAKYLMSEAGKQKIVELHFNAIVQYVLSVAPNTFIL